MLQTLLGLGLGTLLAMAIIWLLPIVLIARSNRTAGIEKIIWILLVVFFSWFSWILYLLIAPLDKEAVR